MREIILTAEQEMLRESAARFLRERYDFKRRLAIIDSDSGYDRVIWRAMADMGWLGLALPEDAGGSGSLLDCALLMEAFGAALVVEPYLPSVVLAGQLVARAGDAAQRGSILPAIIGGESILAFAHGEPQSGYEPYAIATTARREGGGYVLDGRKAVVLGAPAADRLIVTARTSGAAGDRAGLSLFVVDPRAAGVKIDGYPNIDGQRAGEVALATVRVGAADRLGAEGAAADAIDHALAAGTAMLAAQAIGALEGAVNATAAYLNVREQFGRKLAEYQALRHRVADMYMLKEESRALARLAAVLCDEPDAAERDLAVAAAKAYAGEEGRRVCEEAVQLHGAIGITDEIMVGHYLKKLIAVDRTFADVTACLDRFMQASPALARG